MDHRPKHDREMEIGEPTSDTLKTLIQEQQKRAILGMCSFYRTATRYLNRHLPFANELLYDLPVLLPLMLKSQIIRQDYVGQLTDEWKIYQGQEIPEDVYITGHQVYGSNTYWKKVLGT